VEKIEVDNDDPTNNCPLGFNKLTVTQPVFHKAVMVSSSRALACRHEPTQHPLARVHPLTRTHACGWRHTHGNADVRWRCRR